MKSSFTFSDYSYVLEIKADFPNLFKGNSHPQAIQPTKPWRSRTSRSIPPLPFDARTPGFFTSVAVGGLIHNESQLIPEGS